MEQLETPISLSEKLQAAEARAVAAEERMRAAEMALFDEITRAQNCLDITKNHAAGLIPKPERICLAAIASATPDLTAARELIEKAESFDQLAKRIGAIDHFEHMQFAPHSVLAQCETKLALRDKEADTIRTRLAESEALVAAILSEIESDTVLIDEVLGNPDDTRYPPKILRETVDQFRKLAPAAALEQYRAKVLEEVIKQAKPNSMACPNTFVVEVKQIRKMKEPR